MDLEMMASTPAVLEDERDVFRGFLLEEKEQPDRVSWLFLFFFIFSGK